MILDSRATDAKTAMTDFDLPRMFFNSTGVVKIVSNYLDRFDKHCCKLTTRQHADVDALFDQ